MKRRILIGSLSLWLGSSLFLYSDQVLANPMIHDSMNSSVVITSIPNGDQATNSSPKVTIEATSSSAEPTGSTEKRNNQKMSALLHNTHTPLMLDDDFFKQSPEMVMPNNPGSGGEASIDSAFSQAAQSAYLLSGITLYGEASGNFERNMSDHLD